MWGSPGIYTWTPALSLIYQWFSISVRGMFFDSICRWFKYVHVWKRCASNEWKLNSDMENIRQWLCCNRFSLNVSKTHCMVFAPKSKRVDDLNIRIQNTNIERVSVTKFLGVMIDAQLSWKCHIEYTCKKYLNVLELSLKHRRNQINLSWLTYITHLPIHIWFIVIMFGAIHIQPI